MVAIDIKEVSFMRNQRSIFNQLSFSVELGQFIGLLGPNGTGKSTLLKMMAGILPINSGVINVLGKSIRQLKPIELAKIISYMPQSTQLETNFTVEQVVKMGRYPHKSKFSSWTSIDRLAVENAMKQTGIEGYKERLVPSLSGGERQLVYLAKAIAQETPIIFLDEPTSDLDIHHQLLVTNIIHHLVKEGKTVVAAIHDINLASRICDRCLFLRDGKLISYDKCEESITEQTIEETFRVKSYIYEDVYFQKKQVLPYEVSQVE